MMTFWVLVIAGAVLLVYWYSRGAGHGSVFRNSDFEIARERFAKGEISTEEFEVVKRELGQ